MSALDIEAIKARLAAATPGPWHKVQSADEYNEPLPHSYYIPEIDACFDMTEGDAEFIIHAPADIAALLAENERLRARLTLTPEKVQTAIDAMPSFVFAPYMPGAAEKAMTRALLAAGMREKV